MRTKLSCKELFILGGGLFSMHFGAACMLYPVTWGKESGSALWPAFLGILLSGILLPLAGYLALVKGRGNFLVITRRIAPKFGLFFAAVTIIILGPAYIVPRMSAASWASLVRLFGWEFESSWPIAVFTVVYYAIVFWFVSTSSKVVDRVGNILFPILLIIVVAVIAKSMIAPVSDTWAAPEYTQSPLLYGFLQGYATGDLQCALMFGVIVVQGVRRTGIAEEALNINLIKVGIVGLGMLAVAHLGHMIAGANLGGTIDLTLSELYTEMVLVLWGRAGGMLFNIALVAAAITTAIGCLSSTAEIWVEIFDGKFSYHLICAVSCALSILVGVLGLDRIVSVVGPILDAVYPAAIVLSFYYIIDKNSFGFRDLCAARWAVAAALVMGAMNLLHVYIGMFGWNMDWYEKIYLAIPLAKYSLAWFPVSVAAFAAAYFAAHNVEGEAADGGQIA